MAGKRKYSPSNPRSYRKRGSYYGSRAPAPKALRPKYRKRNYRASYKLSKPFRQILGKYLDKDKETHWVQQDIADTGVQGIPFQQPSGAPSGIIELMPSIHMVGAPLMGGGIQEATLETRQGSQVKLKSWGVNLSIRLNPDYSTSQAYMAGVRYKIMVISCKRASDFKDVMADYWNTAGSNNWQNELFLEGATPQAWDSLMQNFENPVNTNLFTVHAMRTGTLTRGMLDGDGHMPLAVRNLHMKIKCKSKMLKFLPGGATTKPENWQPFLWIGYKAYDGSALHSGNYCHVVGNSKIAFDDMA